MEYFLNRFLAVENAVAHARSMADEGADFIDIGAQSTRPGATRLSTEEELSRLVPVLEILTADPALKDVKLSVDTFDARFVFKMNLCSGFKTALILEDRGFFRFFGPLHCYGEVILRS
jgi:hypothetical protein